MDHSATGLYNLFRCQVQPRRGPGGADGRWCDDDKPVWGADTLEAGLERADRAPRLAAARPRVFVHVQQLPPGARPVRAEAEGHSAANPRQRDRHIFTAKKSIQV